MIVCEIYGTGFCINYCGSISLTSRILIAVWAACFYLDMSLLLKFSLIIVTHLLDILPYTLLACCTCWYVFVSVHFSVYFLPWWRINAFVWAYRPMTFVLGFWVDLLLTLRRILFEHFLWFVASLLSVWFRSFSFVHRSLSIVSQARRLA